MTTKGMSPLRSLVQSSPRKPQHQDGSSNENTHDLGSGSAPLVPCRAPLCPIPLPSQLAEGIGNGDTTFKGKPQVSTPRGKSKMQQRTDNSGGTPDKHTATGTFAQPRNRFGWHQPRFQAITVMEKESSGCSLFSPSGKHGQESPRLNEGKDIRTPSKLLWSFSFSESSHSSDGGGAIEGQLNSNCVQNLNRAGNSNQSTPRSTRSLKSSDPSNAVGGQLNGTPNRNVSRTLKYLANNVPSSSGASGARLTLPGLRLTGPLSQQARSAQPYSTDYQSVDAPYFELEEDPSFWNDHNVQVLIRCRPLNSSEISSQGYSRCLRQETAHTVTWIGQPESRFTFDHVVCEKITQEKLFKIAGIPMVDNCMSGYNSCMFAYGQTGSGKTHTMLGDIDELEQRPSDNRGMTPRIFEYLFGQISTEEEVRKNEQLKFTCKCSFLEIYNEQITDLLEPSSTNLHMREDLKKGVYVENLSEVEVKSVQDVVFLLLQGAANRRVAATNMNQESSRSHSVFTCVIESKWESESMTNLRFGRLNLVDLAGSERQKSSGAEGDRLKEAASINKSLSTLGLVIMILIDVAQGKQRHVPYRDSKLTFLLQDSLGGNSKTTIIANVSPSVSCASETLSTLKFAQRAKFIRNNAIVNEDASGDVLALRLQIQQLKEELNRLSRQSISRIPLSSGVMPLELSTKDVSSNVVSCLSGSIESFEAALKKVKSLEAVVVGSLRREKAADNTAKRLTGEIEQLNCLVRQREDDAQFNKMMLRFREDKIRRLEATIDGALSEESCRSEEVHALKEELELMRGRFDRNPELTRFAMENIRLREQFQRLQDFYEGGDREILLEEISGLRDQLSEYLEAELVGDDNMLHQMSEKIAGIKDPYEKWFPSNNCEEENTISKLKALLEEKEARIQWEMYRADELNQQLDNSRHSIEVLENELKDSKEAAEVIANRLQLTEASLAAAQETAASAQATVKQIRLETEDIALQQRQSFSEIQEATTALRLQELQLRSQLEDAQNMIKELSMPKEPASESAENESKPAAAETIMQLQVELEALDCLIQEERSYRKEAEDRSISLNMHLEESEERSNWLRAQINEAEARIEKVSKEFEEAEEKELEMSKRLLESAEDLNHHKMVVESLENQALLSISEINNLQTQNIKLTEALKNRENELKVVTGCVVFLQSELQRELEIRVLEMEASAAKHDSNLKEKLDRTRKALEQAEQLNSKLQNEQNSLRDLEHEKELVRADAEMETTEAITLLQSELISLCEDHKITQERESNAEKKVTQLQMDVVALQAGVKALSEENVHLNNLYHNALKEKDSEISKLTQEWEMAASNLIECLSEGNQALDDAAQEIDRISEECTLQGNVDASVESPTTCKEKNLVEVLERRLLHVQKLAKQTEDKVRSLSDTSLAIADMQRQERTNMQNDLEALNVLLIEKSNHISRQHAQVQNLKGRVQKGEKMFLAACLIINMLLETGTELATTSQRMQHLVDKTASSTKEKETEIHCLQLQRRTDQALLEEREAVILNNEQMVAENALGSLTEDLSHNHEQLELLKTDTERVQVRCDHVVSHSSCIEEKFSLYIFVLVLEEAILKEMLVSQDVEELKLSNQELKAEVERQRDDMECLQHELQKSCDNVSEVKHAHSKALEMLHESEQQLAKLAAEVEAHTGVLEKDVLLLQKQNVVLKQENQKLNVLVLEEAILKEMLVSHDLEELKLSNQELKAEVERKRDAMECLQHELQKSCDNVSEVKHAHSKALEMLHESEQQFAKLTAEVEAHTGVLEKDVLLLQKENEVLKQENQKLNVIVFEEAISKEMLVSQDVEELKLSNQELRVEVERQRDDVECLQHELQKSCDIVSEVKHGHSKTLEVLHESEQQLAKLTAEVKAHTGVLEKDVLLLQKQNAELKQENQKLNVMVLEEAILKEMLVSQDVEELKLSNQELKAEVERQRDDMECLQHELQKSCDIVSEVKHAHSKTLEVLHESEQQFGKLTAEVEAHTGALEKDVLLLQKQNAVLKQENQKLNVMVLEEAILKEMLVSQDVEELKLSNQELKAEVEHQRDDMECLQHELQKSCDIVSEVKYAHSKTLEVLHESEQQLAKLTAEVEAHTGALEKDALLLQKQNVVLKQENEKLNVLVLDLKEMLMSQEVEELKLSNQELKAEVERQRNVMECLQHEYQKSCDIVSEVKHAHSKTLEVLHESEQQLAKLTTEVEAHTGVLEKDVLILQKQNVVLKQDNQKLNVQHQKLEKELSLFTAAQKKVVKSIDAVENQEIKLLALHHDFDCLLASNFADSKSISLIRVFEDCELMLDNIETLVDVCSKVTKELETSRAYSKNMGLTLENQIIQMKSMSDKIVDLERDKEHLQEEKSRREAAIELLQLHSQQQENVQDILKATHEGSEKLLEVVEGNEMKLTGLQRKIQRMTEWLSQEIGNDFKVAFTEGCELVLNEVEKEVQTCREQAEIAWKKIDAVLDEKRQIEENLLERDQMIKNLQTEIAVLQDHGGLAKQWMDGTEKLNFTIRQLQGKLDDKQLHIDKSEDEFYHFQQSSMVASARLVEMEAELSEQKECLSSVEADNVQLRSQLHELIARKEVDEVALADKQHAIQVLEMQLLNFNSLIEQQKAFPLDHINYDWNKALKERDLAIKERDELHADLVVLNEQLEMAQQLAEEHEAIAVEARQIAETSKTRAEQKEEEAKLLERSVEELENTVNALETEVGLVKSDSERQRLMREDTEMELQALRHQMSIMQARQVETGCDWEQIQRDLETKSVRLVKAEGKIQILEKQCDEKNEQIRKYKKDIVEIMSEAEKQASDHHQIIRTLESLAEQRPIAQVPSNSKLADRSAVKPRGSGSPFKCIGSGLSHQMSYEIDEELSCNRQKIEELEALANSRQKEIFMLNVRLAEAESMTHDIIRDLVGVKLDITNYATVMNYQQVQKTAAKSVVQNEQAREKDKELSHLKTQLNEFIEERESWLEEINRRQAEMMTARVAAEKLRQRDQLLSTENETLKMENANQRNRIFELEEEVNKLSGQQNLQQRIHHHAKIKEENNQLRMKNEDLATKLRRSEVLLLRVGEELARYREAEGKPPYIDVEEEQRLKVKLQEVEEEKIQIAQELLSLCTSVLQVAGLTSSRGIDHTVAAEALKHLQDRLDTAEREVSDMKLKNKIESEKRHLSELRSLHSPVTSTNFAAAHTIFTP